MSSNAALALIALVLLALPCLWAYDKVDRYKTQKKLNQARMMSAWNLLMGYRKLMPQGPVPMDEALMHLQTVMSDMGIPLPTEDCPCEDCAEPPETAK